MLTKLYPKKVLWREKIIGLFLLALIPIILLVTLLFINANRTLQAKAIDNMMYGAKEVRSRVDDTVLNVYGVSETFASEQRLLEYLDKTYESTFVKRQSTLLIKRRILDTYNTLKQNEEIAGIYTYKDEFFNFIDPNNDGEEVVKKLMDMGVDDSSRLGQFYWYPLMDNFLTTAEYGDVRKDKVVLGSRRVFSSFKSQYAYIHIFAIQEEVFYKKYANMQEQMNADVYIVNKRGEILSTSNERALSDKAYSASLENLWESHLDKEDGYIQVKLDKVPYYLVYASSTINEWKTLVLVPEKDIFAENKKLYTRLIWILIMTAILDILIVAYTYRGFMNPINQMIYSMERVYEGDLDQEVTEHGQEEVKRMLRNYNSMLRSIKTNIKDRLESDKEKKQLEYEVLMSQVNPHFLYNTLESIVWMATEAKRPDIRRLAASLGRLYRLSVGDGQEIVTVSREIEHVTAYCYLQKNRYQDKIEFHIDVEPALANRCRMIKMILQPIVENSFIHGVDLSEKPVNIYLRLKETEKHLRFYVGDNGVGMTKEKLGKLRNALTDEGRDIETKAQGTGIGLGSVYKRLRLHYGEEGQLKVYSRQGKGTVIMVKIPKMDDK